MHAGFGLAEKTEGILEGTDCLFWTRPKSNHGRYSQNNPEKHGEGGLPEVFAPRTRSTGDRAAQEGTADYLEVEKNEGTIVSVWS